MTQQNIENIIQENVQLHTKVSVLEEKLENARKLNENAKEGSLASKANMVKKFNEGNK